MAKSKGGIVEVVYQKGEGERLCVFSGELGSKYVSKRSGDEIQQLLVTDPETDHLTVLNLPTKHIIRIQAKRLL